MTEFVVEGVAVQEEAWGLLSCAGSYRRLIVRCPVRQGCKKKRSYDAEDSRSGGLGLLEPFAFLGCWLSQHARFASAKEHKALKPSRAAVSEYAKRQGWLPEP